MTTKQKKQISETLAFLNSHKDTISQMKETPASDNPYTIKILDDIHINSPNKHFKLNEYLNWYITNLHDTLAVDKIRSNITKGMEYMS